MRYELIAGLETHIELSTESKIFCGCTTRFAGEPNTHCCPVCTGQPGALPVLNRRVVEYGVMAGLAVNCSINELSFMDRKNYSYPDLPKAYQISQFDIPLCQDGYLELSDGKRIGIERIHIEEDAGKLIHRQEDILIDYNRAGVPLIEIVSHPHLNSTEQVREYVDKLRQLMRFIGISDCRMQEGSMRCDVNISVRPVGETALGTRTEIKNMNSISGIVRAMEYEFERQCRILERGGKILQETLRFDEATGQTTPMRSKEADKDYRFFRDPDLLPVYISKEEIERIRAELPQLPFVRAQRYVREYGLSPEEAAQLTGYRRVSDFFENVSGSVRTPAVAAKFIIGQIFGRFRTEKEKEAFEIKVSEEEFASLMKLLEEGTINHNLAKITLEKMMDTGASVSRLLDKDALKCISEEELDFMCRRALETNPKAVIDYKKGKEKALMALLGYVMRESNGKAEASDVREKLRVMLSE